jgi:hypothetical protein
MLERIKKFFKAYYQIVYPNQDEELMSETELPDNPALKV